MQLGKKLRLERFFHPLSGRSIIVPMDHGLTDGPMPGLAETGKTVAAVAAGGASAVLVHKGLAPVCFGGERVPASLIVHISAGTSCSPLPNSKVLVGSVEDAVRLGADGVSIHVNLGDERERDMLADFGRIASDANAWGMPLVAMVYGRGPKIRDEFDAEVVAHCARVGMELGADVVKVSYPGSAAAFARAVSGCAVPLLIAGGPRLDSDKELFHCVFDSLQAGGRGISFGRNVFSHAAPASLMRSLHGMVHENWSVEEAMAAMKNA